MQCQIGMSIAAWHPSALGFLNAVFTIDALASDQCCINPVIRLAFAYRHQGHRINNASFYAVSLRGSFNFSLNITKILRN
jgi:hypothetical protein